uniref:RRM domain-containing protein n=1 Tax=Quercus lobata TaxID=97700 RepID=A0A7N2MPR8_QUELO
MSSSKLFIGGLSHGTDDQSLKEAFAKYGEVVEARIIMDRETGRSSGFGFVTYVSSEEASSAIQALDGQVYSNSSMHDIEMCINYKNYDIAELHPCSFQDLHGRQVRVNYAADRACPSYGGYGNTGGNFDVSGGSGNFASRDGSKIAGSGFEGSTGQGLGGADQFGTSESSSGGDGGGGDC